MILYGEHEDQTHETSPTFQGGAPRETTSTREWPFKECLAVARIAFAVTKRADGSTLTLYVKSIKGRFVHTAECTIARPINASVLKLHPLVREHAAQLLELKVRAAQVLYENMQLLDREYNGETTTEEHRLLLNAQVQVRKSSFKTRLLRVHTIVLFSFIDRYAPDATSNLDARMLPI